jgi:ribosome biogenesis GTPase
LVTAEAYNIKAVLVFNKFDLIKDDDNEIDDLLWLKKTYEDIGYQCLVTSVMDNKNIDKLKELMKSKTSVFSGHSGVGKSALINSLDKNLNLRIGEVSQIHDKGKHTTTFSEMYSLDFGAYIIDTPGIREFGLIGISKDDLSHFFPDIFKYQTKCKFYNCSHTHEPKCAVIEAVENGEIALSRYENYLNIYSGL